MNAYTEGVHVVSDDTEVLACLAYHNRATAMLQADQLAASQGMPRSFLYWATARALYVVAHFQNYADAQDNGYVMMVVALDIYTKEQAARLATAFVGNSYDFSRPMVAEYVEMPAEEVN